MAIKVTTEEGTVFEFDTVEEAKAFGVDSEETKDGGSLSLSDIDEGDKVRFKTNYTDSATDFVSAGSTAVVDLIDGWEEHVSVHVDGKPPGDRTIWVGYEDVSSTLELVEEEAEESGDPYDPSADVEAGGEMPDPDEGAQVGDKYILTEDSAWFREGDVVEIVRLDGDGVPYTRRLSDGDGQYVPMRRMFPYNEHAAKAGFKVGDKVRLLNNEDPIVVNSEVGAIGTVVENDGIFEDEGVLKVEIENTRTHDTQYVDHTQVELVKPLAQDSNGEDLYDGDYVVAVEDNPYSVTDSDMLCRVTDKEPDNPGFMNVDMTVEITEDGFLSHKGETFEVASKYFVKTTPEEFEASKQPKEPIFESGDYVKVKSLDGFMGGFSVGEIVRIVDGEVNEATGHIRVSKLSHEWNGFPNLSDVEKIELTDRDKAFLKIGREIGEFKHGDLVHVDSDIIGRVGIVVRETGYYTITKSETPGRPLMFNDGVRKKGFVEGRESQLTLICPAEQRLDIGGDFDV